MAATAQTLNYDALLTTTLAAYRKKLEDNIFKANPLFFWLDKGDRKEKQTGGFQIIQPLMYGKNSTAKSYGKYDTLDVTPQDGFTNALFPWKHESVSISISGPEEAQNSGAARILPLLESKITQAEKSLIEELNRQLFLDGTGNSNLDIYGLALLIEEGSAWGVAGSIDSNVETWWRNIWTNSGSFAAQGLNDMRTTYNSASKGNEHPDLILTTQAVMEFYEKILAPLERFTDTTVGDAGFINLKYKASVMMYDAYCTSGYMYFINSDYLQWVVDPGTDFRNTPFVRPADQDAKVAQILEYCNLTISNRARQGLMTAIVA